MKGLVASVLVALVFAACGGGDDGGEPEGRGSPVESADARDIDYEECDSLLGGFLDALAELDSRLGIGLNYDEYGDRVGDIKVEYDQVDFGVVEGDCLLLVAVPAEKALNDFVDALNTWSRCFDRLACDVDSIDPRLQTKWSSAEDELADAMSALRSAAD